MSLLGIDVGTTGCKALVFREDGQVLASAYREYDVGRPQPGWTELDAHEVWGKVKQTIREAAAGAERDPIRALSVSSMGEAMVPVSNERHILGPSILMEDVRGAEYLGRLNGLLPSKWLFTINGNTLGNHYGLTKLLWLKEHRPDMYAADHLLLWGAFVSFMLGASPAVDYSLANRTLLFDIHKRAWSREILGATGLDEAYLPATVASGEAIGEVAPGIAEELGIPKGAIIAAGAHDQCANALGCGVTEEGRAMLGMGTYVCLAPTFHQPPPAEAMIKSGLNVEHHSVPGLFVSFIYNHGGSLLKWYRDTFARAEHGAAQRDGADIYAQLLSEMPDEPSRVIALPHFATTGPPEFISDSRGVLAGLRLETTRGEIVKGILEGAVFYLRDCVEGLAGTGITIESCRVVGGGSRSDAWVQLCADILGRPFARPAQTEAGALGAAILGGVGAGVYASPAEGAEALVRTDRSFEPDPKRVAAYDQRFELYRQLWPTMRDYLRQLAAADT